MPKQPKVGLLAGDRPRRTYATAQDRRAAKILEEAFRVSCDCGRPVLARVIQRGERLGTEAFFDEEDAAPHADQTTRCSGCGRRLDLIAVLRRSG
jgi:hypothetical protein